MHQPSGPTPPPAPGVTRLAPSPTGALHLGNARTFLITWALARQQGLRLVCRVEDLDTPRVKPQTVAQTLDVLGWLGIEWDGDAVIQSADLGPYRDAMAGLAARGLAYPSELSRGEVERAASAPNEGDHEVRFPASLRPIAWPREFVDDGTPWRFATPDHDVAFTDGFRGPTTVRPAESVGDFVVWTRRGTPSYQLAVVVDDHRQGVTHVIRGDDLVDSAGRQTLLSRALGLGSPPAYTHLPLVRGADGRRLAKRHGDTRVAHYRERGVPPERVVGLLAWWCGITTRREPVSAPEFARGFRLGTLSVSDVVFGPEDDQWLMRGG